MQCEAVRSSTQPYELQMRRQDDDEYPLQVYRGKDLTHTEYAKGTYQIFVTKYQSNFHLETHSLKGADVRFIYNVPTDRYIWQQDIRTVTYHTIIAGVPTEGPGFSQTYEMLPDETLSVGACSFPVKHFRYKQNASGRALDEEIWFSPELNTILKIVEVATYPDGQTKRRTVTAVAIRTDFEPFR